MTTLLTSDAQKLKRDMKKLAAGSAGVALCGVCASIALWRLGAFWPNARWSALCFGVLGLGLYIATAVLLKRVSRRISSN
jgi:hypothetical protein